VARRIDDGAGVRIEEQALGWKPAKPVDAHG
jgi:hypothetical protein